MFLWCDVRDSATFPDVKMGMFHTWPGPCEAKMVAHGGQFCTLVLLPHATFYTFLKSFLWKYTQIFSLKDNNEFKNFKYISTKSNQVTDYIFSQK